MYAVIKLWTHPYLGLVVDTVCDEFLTLRDAERHRLEYMSQKKLFGNSVRVIPYEVND